MRELAEHRLRLNALLVAGVCLFWNLIGISVHNHDLDGLDGAPLFAQVYHPSSSPTASISHAALTPVAAPDRCPGCEYQIASVSGALAGSVAPVFRGATMTAPAPHPTYLKPTMRDASSRGPPSV